MTKLSTSTIQRIAIISSRLAIASIPLLAMVYWFGEGSPLAEGGLAAAGTIFCLGLYVLLVLADVIGIRRAVKDGRVTLLHLSVIMWLPLLTIAWCTFYMHLKHASGRMSDIVGSFVLSLVLALKVSINIALMVAIDGENS